jgi:hypothetical protein
LSLRERDKVRLVAALADADIDAVVSQVGRAHAHEVARSLACCAAQEGHPAKVRRGLIDDKPVGFLRPRLCAAFFNHEAPQADGRIVVAVAARDAPFDKYAQHREHEIGGNRRDESAESDIAAKPLREATTDAGRVAGQMIDLRYAVDLIASARSPGMPMPKAFIDGAILPRQSIEASLHQTNAAVLYCPQIEAACLKGHDSGMVNAKDLSFSCRASHGFDRPAGAEAKLKNRIIRRDVQGRDGNAIRRPIDQTHSPSEKPAADARRLPQLLAKQNPSRLKRGHLRLTTP